MKISGNNQNPMTKEADIGKNVTDNRKKTEQIKQGESQNTAVKVLSNTTADKIKESLAQTPEIDQSRVDEIKDRIKNGTFKINPEKIADAMLKEIVDHQATNTE